MVLTRQNFICIIGLCSIALLFALCVVAKEKIELTVKNITRHLRKNRGTQVIGETEQSTVKYRWHNRNKACLICAWLIRQEVVAQIEELIRFQIFLYRLQFHLMMKVAYELMLLEKDIQESMRKRKKQNLHRT